MNDLLVRPWERLSQRGHEAARVDEQQASKKGNNGRIHCNSEKLGDDGMIAFVQDSTGVFKDPIRLGNSSRVMIFCCQCLGSVEIQQSLKREINVRLKEQKRQ